MKRLPILSANVAAALLFVGGFALLAGGYVVGEDPTEAASSETASESDESATETPAGDVSKSAVELLQESRDAILSSRSVSATLHETVAIGTSQFEASGSYVSGEFPKLRLSFEVQVGDTTGTLLQVCDGQLLWTVQTTRNGESGEPTVRASRTVIEELLSEIDRDVPETVLITNLGMGGLPTLLAALERSMTFNEHRTAEHEGKPYSVIQGHWNSDFLAKFGGGGGKPLPEYVPDRVRIYFDQQTKFPTRILYLKESPSDSTLKTYNVLLSLEFSDVVLDGPVNEEQFRYVPEEGTQFENRTDKFLEMIKAAKEKVSAADASK